VAAWTVAQSLRRRDSVFAKSQQRLIWFWTVASIGSLLLAYGRFAPFTNSSICCRMPPRSGFRPNSSSSFPAHCDSLRLWHSRLGPALFGSSGGQCNSPLAQFKNWWMKARGFDRNWSLVHGGRHRQLPRLAIYASEKPSLVRYLQPWGLITKAWQTRSPPSVSEQVGWFFFFLRSQAGLCVLFIAGVFAGKRAKTGRLVCSACCL